MSLIKDILESLRSLDLDRLTYLLPDNGVYFGVSKITFLNKLEYIFIQLRLAEKTDIRVERIGVDVYSVVLVPFEAESHWLFDLSGNESITIKHAKKLEEFDIEGMTPVQFYFFDDEKVGFVCEEDYLKNKEICRTLLGRVEGSITGVSMAFVKDWYNDCKFFYNRIKYLRNYKAYHRFLSTYDAIGYLLEIFSFDPFVRKALTDELSWDKKYWYSKYERVYYTGTMGVEFIIPLQSDGVFELRANTRIRILKRDMFLFYVFNKMLLTVEDALAY